MKLMSLLCLLNLVLCWNMQAGESTKQRASSLVGHFVYSREGNYACDVDITVQRQKGRRYSVGLAAARPEGKGAAPDGGGEGEVDSKGVLHFTFEDSFFNRGPASFRRVGPGRYRLKIDIVDVKDSRCLIFYGDCIMRRVPHA